MILRYPTKRHFDSRSFCCCQSNFRHQSEKWLKHHFVNCRDRLCANRWKARQYSEMGLLRGLCDTFWSTRVSDRSARNDGTDFHPQNLLFVGVAAAQHNMGRYSAGGAPRRQLPGLHTPPLPSAVLPRYPPDSILHRKVSESVSVFPLRHNLNICASVPC